MHKLCWISPKVQLVQHPASHSGAIPALGKSTGKGERLTSPQALLPCSLYPELSCSEPGHNAFPSLIYLVPF